MSKFKFLISEARYWVSAELIVVALLALVGVGTVVAAAVVSYSYWGWVGCAGSVAVLAVICFISWKSLRDL